MTHGNLYLASIHKTHAVFQASDHIIHLCSSQLGTVQVLCYMGKS